MSEISQPIGITMGDPCGIGPEILLKACAELLGPSRKPATRLLAYGDPAFLGALAHRLRLPIQIEPVADSSELADRPGSPGCLPVVDCARLDPDLPTGRIDARGGQAAYQAIVRAARDALAGQLRAIVTAPIHKEAMHAAGMRHPGHTELLAELAGGADVRMMLANDELRTVLVTIHDPLRVAIERITREAVRDTVVIADAALRRLGLAQPRIAVAGLNPHAGEGGLMGREDIEAIAPAIADARTLGIDASGPWPGDTVFMRARGFREFDLVVAMYHDQGLIPIKYLGIDNGVNVTIGLPFVRTSVDHGTAFDIAGRGIADHQSLLAAIRMAEALTHGAPST